MLMFNYLRKRTTFQNKLLVVFFMLILSIFTFSLLVNTTSAMAPAHLDLIPLLVMTIQSFHNQTIYLLPITSALIVLALQKATPVELYWLTLNDTLKSFCLTQIIKVLLIYMGCLLLGTTAFGLIYHQFELFSFTNVLLGLGFLSLHFVGFLLSSYILMLLLIFFEKIIAYLLFLLLLYLDASLFTHFNVSLIIGNGLTMSVDTFDLIIALKDLSLTALYFIILTKYSQPLLLRGVRL
ncbi:hypothetical protein C5Z26_05010 [Lactobacillus sp. CBA3606]|uniref:hypothetical protein n=1 Tax=Lactobacillus sp. CBA3606 TaxID=2099789 RepID=UPI000CFBB8B8|nr:hypothetical protein [Lactobacillus sp. CBA3606]AVK63500.1 hypothetical protein C5Z26_05010 [Lactobacillus sp. CBA3606]